MVAFLLLVENLVDGFKPEWSESQNEKEKEMWIDTVLLATKEVGVVTHNGGLKQFNFLFIYKGDGTFCRAIHTVPKGVCMAFLFDLS